jgi:hypothetical protein
MEERLAFLSSVSSTNGPLMNNVAIFLAARRKVDNISQRVT